MSNKQLYEKQNGNYKEVYPNTLLSSILDRESGKSLKDIISTYNHLYVPFVNNIYETLTAIPIYIRRKGLWVTWETENDINTYQFNLSTAEAADDAIWGNIESWEQIPDLDYYEHHAAVPDGSITLDKLSEELRDWLVDAGKIVNNPDNESISEEHGILKIADRHYNDDTSSMGYIILNKNKTFTEQITEENTIYEIRYNFDLNEETIIIPNNCVLKFEGGCIKNSSNLVFVNTLLIGTPKFSNCTVSGTIVNNYIYSKWFNTTKFNTFSKLIADNSNKTLFLDAITYDLEEDTVISSGTKIKGIDKNLTKIQYIVSDIKFITRQITEPTYNEIISRQSYNNKNIEISNLTMDSSTIAGYCYLRDCDGLYIHDIIFNSENDLERYPKALEIYGCRNIKIYNCISNKVPLTRIELSSYCEVYNNFGYNIDSTFCEINRSFINKIFKNYVEYHTNNLSVLSSNSCDTIIEYNIVVGNENKGYGITCGHEGSELIASNNIVKNNKISGTYHGILVQNSSNLFIDQNIISALHGIWFLNDSNDVCTITNNDITQIENVSQESGYGDIIKNSDSIYFYNNIYKLNGQYSAGKIQFLSTNLIDCKNNSISNSSFKATTWDSDKIIIENCNFHYIEFQMTTSDLKFCKNKITGYHNLLLQGTITLNNCLIEDNNMIAQALNSRLLFIRTNITIKYDNFVINNIISVRDYNIYLEGQSKEYSAEVIWKKAGSTLQRPTLFFNKKMYYDTDLNKPIWCKDTTNNIWIDAAGNVV